MNYLRERFGEKMNQLTQKGKQSFSLQYQYNINEKSDENISLEPPVAFTWSAYHCHISLEWEFNSCIRLQLVEWAILKKCQEESLSAKEIFDKSVKGNNLIMTLYFSCLQECTECLIDIFSLAPFLESFFQRWGWQIGSNALFIFHCIF